MPFSDLFSPDLSGLAQRLGLQAPAPKGMEALAPHGLVGGWTQTERFNSKVDQRLSDALSKAAERFAIDHPGYTVEAYSGYRPGDKRQHGKHRAIDVRIKDPSGNIVPNYQSAQSFRTYESLAQNFKSVVDQDYPDLSEKARWGGYFAGPVGKYGAADLMHFDLGGLSGLGMAGGSWDKGLTDAQRGFFPGAVSIGMGMQPAESVPTPTARPDSPAELANIASLNAIQNKREYERPSFAAPLGPVERAHLAEALNGAPSSLPPDRQMPSGDVRSSISRGAFAGLPPDRQMPSGPVQPSTAPQGAFARLTPDRPMPSGPIEGTPYKSGVVATPADRPHHFLDTAAISPVGALGLAVADRAGFLNDKLGSLPPDRAMPAGPISLAPDRQMPSGPVSAAPAGAFASNFAARPDVVAPNTAASAQPTPTDVSAASPARPDNLNYAGPKGMFSVSPNLMSPDLMSTAAPALSPPTTIKDNVIAPISAPAVAVARPAVRQHMPTQVAQPAAPARQAQSMPSIGGVKSRDAFSVGTGLQGITAAQSGPRGAFASSLSNPGMGVMSLGPNQGTATYSSKFGTTTYRDPSGKTTGTQYDKPGGFFGALGRALGIGDDHDKGGGKSSGKSSSGKSGGKGAFGGSTHSSNSVT